MRSELAIGRAPGTAVLSGQESMSYGEFRRLVGQIRRELESRNARSVLIRLPQGPLAYALIWACYLSRVAFVPLYLGTPEGRFQSIKRALSPDLIFDSPAETVDFALALRTNFDPVRAERPDLPGVAYVIFTSGSTGDPKGVMVRRDSLDKVITWSKEEFEVDRSAIWGQFLPLGFDLGLFDVFLGVSSGATLVPFATLGDKLRPLPKVESHALTHWHSVPTAANLWPHDESTAHQVRSIRKFLFCGEPLLCDQAAFLLEANPTATVHNNYGPTETTIFVTSGAVPRSPGSAMEATCALGTAIPGNEITLEERLDGLSEIVVHGDSVADGYFGSESDRFFVDSLGRRSFLTGDLCRLDPRDPSTLYFSARTDDQVKVNGFRVELTEIEAALNREGFKDAACIFSDGELRAFVVGKHETTERIFRTLSDELPSYMLPKKIWFIDEMPRLANGKIDRLHLATLTARELGGTLS